MGLLKPNIHYTVDDYEQWEGRWELWYGAAVALASPATRHGEFAVELGALILNGVRRQRSSGGGGCACQVFSEIDWRVSIDLVVRPDLSVVCGERMDHAHINRPPTLIAEVLSPSTERTDRDAKRNLYAVQGVLWYLLLDPADGRLTCLRLADGRYREEEPVDDVFTIELHQGCRIELPVEVTV